MKNNHEHFPAQLSASGVRILSEVKRVFSVIGFKLHKQSIAILARKLVLNIYFGDVESAFYGDFSYNKSVWYAQRVKTFHGLKSSEAMTKK